MNRQEQQFENDLCALVAKHGWLDGATWEEVTERVGRGYFDDYPDMDVVTTVAHVLAIAKAD